MYRKLAESASAEDIAALRTEFSDRFGPVPPPVERLLKIAELRIVAAQNSVRQIETREERIMLTRRNDLLMDGNRLPRFKSKTPDERLNELTSLVRTVNKWSR